MGKILTRPELQGGATVNGIDIISVLGIAPLSFGAKQFIVPTSVSGESTPVQNAVNRATAGGVIYLAPGVYAETVTIPRSKGSLTIVGTGNPGDVAIVPAVAGTRALTFNNDGLTVYNIDFAADVTADFGVFGTGSRYRFYGCKFEQDGGPGVANALVGVGPGSVANNALSVTGHSGDGLFAGCEFAWGFNGLATVASDYGQATEVRVEDCWFHDVSGTHIITVPGAFGIGSVGGLACRDNQFSRDEAGAKPSDYIKVDDAADTGFFDGNRFALATNTSADLKIGAKVFWGANATEAGWSTARPA